MKEEQRREHLRNEIEMARSQLDDAMLTRDFRMKVYVQSVKLDKLIEEYIQLTES